MCSSEDGDCGEHRNGMRDGAGGADGSTRSKAERRGGDVCARAVEMWWCRGMGFDEGLSQGR